MPAQWNFIELIDRVRLSLQGTEDALRLEQAVYGLDAREERELQSLLAERLAEFYAVAREVHYPSTFGRKLSHRPRCDLVLAERGRPLKWDSAEATLFDPADMTSPTDALWLEVKIAYQFRAGGVVHGGYGTQWRQAVIDDLRKMEADPLIRHAGLLLVVFNESEDILRHDLERFDTLLAEKEILAGERHVRGVAILDRIGHRLCTMAVWPTIQR